MKGKLTTVFFVSLLVLLALNLGVIGSRAAEAQASGDQGHGKVVGLAVCKSSVPGAHFVLFRMFEDGHVETGFALMSLEPTSHDQLPTLKKPLDIAWR